MRYRSSLRLKQEILVALYDGKPRSFIQLERRIRSNWRTVRIQCNELSFFGMVKIEKMAHHDRNNKPFYHVGITERGQELVKQIVRSRRTAGDATLL